MISDEELTQLPDEPDLAFVEFEKIVRARVEQQELQEWKLRDEGVPFSADAFRREYMNKVIAAARVYGVSELENWRTPPSQHEVYDLYTNFTSEVDQITTQVRLRYAPRARQNSVGLDGNTKTKIHHYIGQIRAAIEESGFPEDKRDSLYAKLHAFALDVDKNRTNLQSAMAVFIAVADGIGQGFQKLEPARKWVDSIAALLGRAKEVEDSLRPALQPPVERKQLEAPRSRLPSSAPTGGNLDDEIPF
jgi:hypothetical protein